MFTTPNCSDTARVLYESDHMNSRPGRPYLYGSIQNKMLAQATHIQKFDSFRLWGMTETRLLLCMLFTTDKRVIRNVEYFSFTDGKIKSIEVFFGGAGQGFPTNRQQ